MPESQPQGTGSPEETFAVDPEDIRRFMALLVDVDVNDVGWAAGQLDSADLDSLSSAGYVVSEWSRGFQPVRSQMQTLFGEVGGGLKDYQDALHKISTAYLATDEVNRRHIDEVFVTEGHNPGPYGRLREQTVAPFDYVQHYDQVDRSADATYPFPDRHFDGVDPVDCWFGVGDAKTFIRHLGVDTEEVARVFGGDWSVLFAHERAMRIVQDVGRGISANVDHGMANLDVTWKGAAYNDVRLRLGNFSKSVEHNGYLVFDGILDAYTQYMNWLDEAAGLASSSLRLGLHGTQLALAMYPGLNLFNRPGGDVSSYPYPDPGPRPGQLGTQLSRELGPFLTEVNEAVSIVDYARFTAASSILGHAAQHIDRAVLLGVVAIALYHQEVEPHMDDAVEVLAAVEVPRVQWS